MVWTHSLTRIKHPPSKRRTLGSNPSVSVVDTKTKGEITEATVMAELVKREVPVLTPFGENHRYDFVIEVSDEFHRLQCKTSSYHDEYIIFEVRSSSLNTEGMSREDYHGDVDYFITTCQQIDEVYLVPIGAVGTSEKRLRLVPPENNQSDGVSMASDYRLDQQLSNIRMYSGGGFLEDV